MQRAPRAIEKVLEAMDVGEHLPDKDLMSHMHVVVDQQRPGIDRGQV